LYYYNRCNAIVHLWNTLNDCSLKLELSTWLSTNWLWCINSQYRQFCYRISTKSTEKSIFVAFSDVSNNYEWESVHILTNAEGKRRGRWGISWFVTLRDMEGWRGSAIALRNAFLNLNPRKIPFFLQIFIFWTKKVT
jgi:hypothetical protein